MIEVEDLIYDYPAQRALHGVSFRIAKGAVLALVGPNGAGKTTLMRCVAALDTQTQGVIRVDGHNTLDHPRAVHAALGYQPDFFGLYDELTVRKSLLYAARSRGVGADRADAAALTAAQRVEIDDRMEQRAGELSRGLRQRLAIAQTIVHEPRVLLLDEPASGLDPEARRSLSDLITKLAAQLGMTIVVSSHILSELEDYCTEMLMIKDGRVAGGGVLSAGGPVGAAPAAGGPETLVDLLLAQPRPELADILQRAGAAVVRATAEGARVSVVGGPEAEAALLGRLVAAGLPLRAFSPVKRTLEQAYLEEVRKPSATPVTGEAA